MNKWVISILIFLSPLWAQDLVFKIHPEAKAKLSERTTLQAKNIDFDIKPLYSGSRSDLGQNWYIATAKQRSTESPWDVAHAFTSENDALVAYAEPEHPEMNDLYRDLAKALRIAFQEEERQSRYNKDWSYPNPEVFDWNFKDSHGQLGSARKEASYKEGERIRVGHFDTGYSPINFSTPMYLLSDLEKNFVKGENPDSAVDPGVDGLIDQPGHGTFTLSILAGRYVEVPHKNFKGYLGGAPEVEVVPVRLSTTVVMFQTSIFAQALYHAIETDCDVVTMSMGGVASKLWEEAVNEAYEKGVTVVTAAGNNWAGGLPTTNLVFPAKFKRVVAVCGAGYDHKPYFKKSLFLKQQGCFGPDVLMDSAIAAYTPNVPSAKYKNPTGVGSAAGTSAATPQIAAAAALWLQKYNETKYEHPWQRVNAVRHALFSSAAKNFEDSRKYFGNGVYRAADALEVAPKIDTEPIPKDNINGDAWLSVLLGWETLGESPHQNMLEVEVLQLEQANPELRKLTEKIQKALKMTDEDKKAIREVLNKIPEASQTLRNTFK